jgi:hypothetical protein
MYALGGRGGWRGSRSCFRFRFRAGCSTAAGAIAAGTLLQSRVWMSVRFPHATAVGRGQKIDSASPQCLLDTVSSLPCVSSDRQAGMHAGRQADRQACRHADRQTGTAFERRASDRARTHQAVPRPGVAPRLLSGTVPVADAVCAQLVPGACAGAAATDDQRRE